MFTTQVATRNGLGASPDMNEVRTAEVAELYRHGIPGVFGALIGTFILTVGLWPSVPHERLLLWLGAFLVSLIPRIAIGIRFLKIKPTGAAAEPWASMFAVGTFTGALFWAAVPIFLFPDDNFLRQALVTFVLGGLCGGIIVANAARRASQIPFILIVSSALVGRFIYEGGRDYVTMAVLWTVLTAYLLIAAQRMHSTITDSLKLRFENKRNIETLVSRNLEIEQLNETLRHKIAAVQQAEEELRASQRELEDRVLARTQDLAKANEQLKAEINERVQVEKALRASEERYRIHFENVREVIFSYNHELEILEVTPSVRVTLGYSPEELVGRRITDFDILPPDDLMRALEDGRRVLGGEAVEPRIYSFIHKDRTTRIGEVSGAPLRRDGQVIGVVSVARDITDRWRAEEALRASEEKYRSIIENIEEGYFEVDLKGNIVNFNDAACTILGYSREELTGLNYREYIDEENAKKVLETFNTVLKTGQGTKLSHWYITRKDGTRRTVETPISLLYGSNAEPCGFRGLARDVTARAEQEEALRKAYDELELRVEERTRELNTTNDQLRLQIEEREKAEKELRESERRYRLLADNVTDIIWTMDLNFHQTYCSPSVERMRGFTVDEAVSQSLVLRS